MYTWNAFRQSRHDDKYDVLYEEDFLPNSNEDAVGEGDGEERSTELFIQRGITRVLPSDPRYKAATNLITAMEQDLLDRKQAGTIKLLKNLRDKAGSVYSKYSKYSWANSARLDNQGDYKEDDGVW